MKRDDANDLPESEGNSFEEEELLKKIFSRVGKREGIPEHLKKSWKQTVETELHAVIERKKSRRLKYVGGLCASILIMVIAIWFNPNTTYSGPVVATLIRSVGDVVSSIDQRKYDVVASSDIYDNTVVATKENSFIAFSYHNAIVRLNESSKIIILDNSISLVQGEIYIDSGIHTENSLMQPIDDTGGQSHASHSTNTAHSVVIETPLGWVTDIGTQFFVSYAANELKAAVREGEIELKRQGQVHHAKPSENKIKGILVAVGAGNVSASGAAEEVTEFESDLQSDEWSWIYSVAPVFEMDGKSVFDYLRWYSNETGTPIHFSSPGVEREATTTILHGKIPTIDPRQSIYTVLPTTQFEARRSDGKLELGWAN